jgi:hypothetical protein
MPGYVHVRGGNTSALGFSPLPRDTCPRIRRSEKKIGASGAFSHIAHRLLANQWLTLHGKRATPPRLINKLAYTVVYQKKYKSFVSRFS